MNWFKKYEEILLKKGFEAEFNVINNIVTIEIIGVPKELHGKGYGTKILNSIIQKANEFGYILQLRPSASSTHSRSKLINFYKKFGFIENKGENKNDKYQYMYKLPESKKMKLSEKILFESTILKEDKIVKFKNPNDSNFVVMIGSPGAGKSYIVKNFLNLKNFKILSADIWLEILAKKNNIDLKNPKEVEKLSKSLDNKWVSFRKNFLTQQLLKDKPDNIVLEVTGKSSKTIEDLVKFIEFSNYNTTLVFVITSKEEAIKRNNERERTVPIDFLIKAYDNVKKTYDKTLKLFDNVWLIYNDDPLISISANTYERDSNKILKIK